jgi:hypothetical protein
MITLENLEEYGIGNNFSDRIFPQDIEFITYGEDSDAIVTEKDPTTANGVTPWWKEPSYNRWWKVGPRPSDL